MSNILKWQFSLWLELIPYESKCTLTWEQIFSTLPTTANTVCPNNSFWSNKNTCHIFRCSIGAFDKIKPNFIITLLYRLFNMFFLNTVSATNETSVTSQIMTRNRNLRQLRSWMSKRQTFWMCRCHKNKVRELTLFLKLLVYHLKQKFYRSQSRSGESQCPLPSCPGPQAQRTWGLDHISSWKRTQHSYITVSTYYMWLFVFTVRNV